MMNQFYRKGGDNWTLHDERRYLDGLGLGKWSTVQSSRKTLLESYIKTINCRTEPWISKARDYAVLLLEEEKQRLLNM